MKAKAITPEIKLQDVLSVAGQYIAQEGKKSAQKAVKFTLQYILPALAFIAQKVARIAHSVRVYLRALNIRTIHQQGADILTLAMIPFVFILLYCALWLADAIAPYNS